MKEGERETIAEMIERIEAAELARIRANQNKNSEIRIGETPAKINESTALTSSTTDERKLEETREIIEKLKLMPDLDSNQD